MRDFLIDKGNLQLWGHSYRNYEGTPHIFIGGRRHSGCRAMSPGPPIYFHPCPICILKSKWGTSSYTSPDLFSPFDPCVFVATALRFMSGGSWPPWSIFSWSPHSFGSSAIKASQNFSHTENRYGNLGMHVAMALSQYPSHLFFIWANRSWSTKQWDEDNPHACGHGNSHSPIIHIQIVFSICKPVVADGDWRTAWGQSP